MNARIDQNDLKKLQKKLDNLRLLDKKLLAQNIGETALIIANQAKMMAPVDAGKLRQSISTQKQGKQATITAAVDYAPYIEFGTGRFVDLSDLTELGIPESYAAQFKGKGLRDVNLPARPFLYPAARYGLKTLLNKLTTYIKKNT